MTPETYCPDCNGFLNVDGNHACGSPSANLELRKVEEKLKECQYQNSHIVSANIELMRKLDRLEEALKSANELLYDIEDNQCFKGDVRGWLDKYGSGYATKAAKVE